MQPDDFIQDKAPDNLVESQRDEKNKSADQAMGYERGVMERGYMDGRKNEKNYQEKNWDEFLCNHNCKYLSDNPDQIYIRHSNSKLWNRTVPNLDQ